MALAKQNRPADPGEAQNLDDFLCFAIYSANLAVNRLNKPVLDELGLTYLQYIVLVALYEHDDQTVGGLGDKLFLDSSTLTPGSRCSMAASCFWMAAFHTSLYSIAKL